MSEIPESAERFGRQQAAAQQAGRPEIPESAERFGRQQAAAQQAGRPEIPESAERAEWFSGTSKQ